MRDTFSDVWAVNCWSFFIEYIGVKPASAGSDEARSDKDGQDLGRAVVEGTLPAVYSDTGFHEKVNLVVSCPRQF